MNDGTSAGLLERPGALSCSLEENVQLYQLFNNDAWESTVWPSSPGAARRQARSPRRGPLFGLSRAAHAAASSSEMPVQHCGHASRRLILLAYKRPVQSRERLVWVARARGRTVPTYAGCPASAPPRSSSPSASSPRARVRAAPGSPRLRRARDGRPGARSLGPARRPVDPVLARRRRRRWETRRSSLTRSAPLPRIEMVPLAAKSRSHTSRRRNRGQLSFRRVSLCDAEVSRAAEAREGETEGSASRHRPPKCHR
ncbi:hypothetical protein THAOC_17353, partial [Thalassiosira oceanica]